MYRLLKCDRCLLLAALVCSFAGSPRAEAQIIEPGPSRSISPVSESAKPAWANDWVQFAAFAEQYISETFKASARYISPGFIFSIPEAIEQPIVWAGIYSGFLGAPSRTNDSSSRSVLVKLYPVIRAPIEGCLVIGDHLILTVPETDLAPWNRLKSGMIVRVSATLGTAQATLGPNPAGATAHISKTRREGECSLGLMVVNPKLLDAW